MEYTYHYKLLTNIAIISVLMVGGVALLGWWTDHAMLVSWLPGIANMTFNTALFFVLMALACWCIRLRMVVVGLSVAIGIFSFLSLLQDFFGYNFAIDNLFFDVYGTGLTSPYPGRMSPNTAGGFFLSSIILITLSLCQHLSRRTFFIHACILLVLLLSFVGVVMNTFFVDPPQGFAHFASMSLFTAILFFFLGIAFLGAYVRQYEGGELDVLMHSGVQLMYNLKYPQKFLLISLVMLVPLSMLMWSKLDALEGQVQVDKIKMIGLEHVMATEGLLVAIPEHRGMLNVHLMDKNAFGHAVLQKRKEIEHLFKVNALIDQQQQSIVKIPEYWPWLKQRWSLIKENSQNPVVSWHMHTEIIALLAKHLREIGGMTRLSYDEDPMIHSLIALQLEVLPQLLEKMGRLRGRGAGFLASGEINVSSQVTLGAMSSDILLFLSEFDQLVMLAMQHQSSDELDMLKTEYMKRSHAFLYTAHEQLIEGKLFSVSAEEYFVEATQALDAGYAFSTRSMQWVQAALSQRINQSKGAQYKIKLLAMLMMMLILYLFMAFYQSVMNTIHALDKAAHRMRKGEAGGLEISNINDEMGAVVGSFNAIAEELRRVSLHMSAVVDHTLDGIITIDQQGVITSFNPAAEAIFAYVADEVIGQNITMLMPGEYRERHQAGLRQYINMGEGAMSRSDKQLSVHGLKKDGVEFPMDLSISTMRMQGQLYFIGTLRDMTEKEKVEKQLLHAQKMEVVGALVGGIAHNFNNLLAGITGKAYLAKSKLKNNPEVAELHLNAIENIAQKAGAMVAQLLTFARKDFFRDQQVTALDVLIQEGFNTAKLGVAEDVALRLDISGSTMMVRCDANQIQQVLMNMVNNARDAVAGCREKKIVVALYDCVPQAAFFVEHDALQVGTYACLKISDTGHGMDAQTIERIFDPFYTTKAVGEGTGLGLSSAFGSIASHGGVIEVDSEVGRGTTFRVYLPLVEADDVGSTDEDERVIYSKNHEMLLLVDDDELVVEAMRDLLEDLGYNVLVAKDGVAGLACFEQNKNQIHGIISDVVMPKMGGVEMLRAIRSIHATVPVIFMTGYDEGAIQLTHQEQVTTTVLYKTVQVPELSRMIQSALHDGHVLR